MCSDHLNLQQLSVAYSFQAARCAVCSHISSVHEQDGGSENCKYPRYGRPLRELLELPDFDPAMLGIEMDEDSSDEDEEEEDSEEVLFIFSEFCNRCISTIQYFQQETMRMPCTMT